MCLVNPRNPRANDLEGILVYCEFLAHGLKHFADSLEEKNMITAELSLCQYYLNTQ